MLQKMLNLVSGATMLADDEKKPVYGQVNDPGQRSMYTYTNDAGGFSDGRSGCNYDDMGMFSCSLVQPAPSAYPAWQGTPDTWDTH
mmetsp:Transcript_5354/g.7937  ORF Transcript_5354/g.7937 Transcript_5354/m.7937 type:complete len:86 (+) Transcript_5354:223-480(+)